MSPDHLADTELINDLAAAAPAFDPPTTARLQARLVARAGENGLLDVSYRTVDSPIGRLLLAATPAGLVRVAFDCEGLDTVLERLAGDISPRILAAPARLDTVAIQLDEYFNGRRRIFELPVDLQLSRGFRRTVLDHLREVAYGTTVSYAGLALAAGNPKAVRAAGSACATNPLPVVIPCHRVLRSDGTVGRYLAGPDTKRALLAMEAA